MSIAWQWAISNEQSIFQSWHMFHSSGERTDLQLRNEEKNRFLFLFLFYSSQHLFKNGDTLYFFSCVILIKQIEQGWPFYSSTLLSIDDLQFHCYHMMRMFTSGFFRFNVRSCAVSVSWQFRPTSGCNISSTEETLWLRLRSPLSAAENRRVVTLDTRPRLPASRRMSVGAPRGLASSGQKPITEILHPLSAAEEPISPGPDVTVNVGGEKVGSAGAVPRPVRRFESNQVLERGRLTQLYSVC